MDKRIIVDSSFSEETRVAFINGSDIEHFEVDTSSNKKQLKGNIYLAKVGRVEPSLQAAFVDFGGNRQGFLPFNEIKDDYYKIPSSDSKNEKNIKEDEVEDYYSNSQPNKTRNISKIPKFKRYKIQEVIKKGQIMLVQISKDERGNKGAALTTFLSLAGKYCVLMPNKPLGIKISKRISNFNEKKKLKSIASACDLSKDMGLIIRTASQDCTEKEIKNDFEYVLNIWKSIKETTINSLAPCLINEDSNIVKKFIRDSYIEEYKEIVVEGREMYEKASAYMKQILPNQAKKIKEYKNDKMPIMEFYDLENKINYIYDSKVLLKSGGYLVINPTEALTSIDINSGRSTKERNIEETALKTNLEAVDEITKQIRIRNIAGLIVIDFIDMEIYKNKMLVERRLKDALRYDRAKCQMGRISRFGLLEVSRQRIGPSIIETTMEDTLISGIRCTIRSITSSIVKILKKLKYLNISKKVKELHVFLHKKSHEFIEKNNIDYINSIEEKNKIKIKLITDNNIAPPFFIIKEVESNKKNKVIYDDLPKSLIEDEEKEKKFINKTKENIKNKIKKKSPTIKKEISKKTKKVENKKKNVNSPEIQPTV
tara:strand:- start:1990 stop:3780 length:1791 start_codon:yes stop_codon:yes gene_type:complete